MKQTFTPTFLFIFVVGSFVNAQAPDWAWAKSAGGISNDLSLAISTDAIGNSYIGGFFRSPKITFGNDTFTNNAYAQLFVTKYDPLGNVIWTQVPGDNKLTTFGITTDINGNAYIITNIGGPDTVNFGPYRLVSNTAEPYLYNMVIAKLNATGNFIWVKTIGGLDGDAVAGIGIDSAGNTYITGYFQSPKIIFGNDTITNTDTTQTQIFIAKLDTAGNAVWGKCANSTNVDAGNYGLCIATDKNGNSYISGEVGDKDVIFGTDTFTFGNKLAFECFIAKYNASGKLLWAKCASGVPVPTANSAGYDICADDNGYFYLTGNFNDTMFLANDTIISPNNDNNIFVAKFDSSGNIIWVINSIGLPAGSGSTGITVDAIGNVYVTGIFQCCSEFTIGNDTLINTDSASDHFFVAKLSPAGHILWIKSDGSIHDDYCSGVSTDLNGNCYITGGFQSSQIIFGNDTLINNAVDPNDLYYDNIFIAKIGTDLVTNTQTLSPPTSAITVYPNPSTGQFYFKGVSEGSTIEIYNVLGQQIYSSPVSGDNYTVNLSANAKGIYIYNIRTKTGVIQQGKLVVE